MGAVAEMGTRVGSGDGNEGGREAKERKKPHKSCKRHVGNGGELGLKKEKTYSRQESTAYIIIGYLGWQLLNQPFLVSPGYLVLPPLLRLIQ